MRIILEDNDKNYIEKINQGLNTDNPVPVFCGEKKEYLISFEVMDIAKASSFVAHLMSSQKTKEVEDILGLRVTSINYSIGDVKLRELKYKLERFLEELNDI